MKINNTVITDPELIRNEWMNYFLKLYSNNDSPEYDASFKQNIEEELKEVEKLSFTQTTVILDNPFSYEEIYKMCRDLKCNKATGWDGITPEHIKY